MSVCEEECDFTQYDEKNNKVLCSCYIKVKLPLISEIKVDKEKLISNFKNIKNIGNFKVLSCLYLLYNFSNILTNSANFMVIILFILSLISIFIFICYNSKKIKNYIWIFQNKLNKKEKEKKISFINNKKRNKKNKSKANNKNISFKNKKISKQNLKRVQNSQINFNLLQLNNNNFNFNDIKRKRNINSISKSKIRRKCKQSKGTNNNYFKSKNKLINIKTSKKKFNLFNDIEMNSLDYKEAKLKDKRTYCQYYLSLLRTKHILIFTFCQTRDYNSQIIKIYIFFFTFAINYNA